MAAISSRTFNTLAKRGISVFLVSPTEDAESFSFALREADAENALSLLKTEFAPEISSGSIENIDLVKNLSIVAVVGEDILSQGSISPRVINTLERASISPVAVSEGASKTTVTFAVPEESTNITLQLIHSLFF